MGRIISTRDLYAAERAVKECDGVISQAAQKLGVSDGAVRIRLDRLEKYRNERAEERQAQRFERMPSANISTLQRASPEHFEIFVNEILIGERLYSPVKTYKTPKGGERGCYCGNDVE